MDKFDNKNNNPETNNPRTDPTISKVDQALDAVDGAMQHVSRIEGDVKSEVQGLVWALVDEYIDEPGLRRLETLVLQSPEARTTYVRCIQLHVDLIYYFADQRRKDDPSAPATPFPLPTELQKILQSEAAKKQSGADPARCSARRPQPSRTFGWLTDIGRRLDNFAWSFCWTVRMMFERI